MAINFANGGTQSHPAGLIQVVSYFLDYASTCNSNQSAWYDWISGFNITTKAANSEIILHTSLNGDVTGGSTGHFARMIYSTNNSSWSTFNNPSNYGSRQQSHWAWRNTSGSYDPFHRSHRQILDINHSAGQTIYFKLQSYLIPGAATQVLNRGQNDGNNNNNVRATSYVILEEFVNPT